ncbi:hypothetical protein FTUN_8514 [Frigoriglobus tundricola]|uniref:Uncharacterized protein n=1 Tax=Frigoriglobus tundricola TaxID=2774151 RepID=A0A6M5Z460_9BACT|nr:hypothetical protein FTUN_8514 [Frigoriglobus tundricola]
MTHRGDWIGRVECWCTREQNKKRLLQENFQAISLKARVLWL